MHPFRQERETQILYLCISHKTCFGTPIAMMVLKWERLRMLLARFPVTPNSIANLSLL